MFYSLTGIAVQVGDLYDGDMVYGDREATEQEVIQWQSVQRPQPIDIIREIESPNDDNRKKIFRQFMLEFLFREAKLYAQSNPPTSSWTDEQIHMYLMAQGKAYAKFYIEEQAIIPWRELIP